MSMGSLWLLSSGVIFSAMDFPSMHPASEAVTVETRAESTAPAAAGGSCLADADCDDFNACTVDGCAAGGQCTQRRDGKIYWTDPYNDKIHRADLDGLNAEEILSARIRDPRRMALDSANGKMYWTDYDKRLGRGMIVRTNLDGTQRKELFNETWSDAPDGIALDLTAGKFYWTDASNALGRIFRANLDGTNVEIVVPPSGPSNPRGLALDVAGGKMYFSAGSIYRADLDGSNLEAIFDLADGVTDPRGLALHLPSNKIYWVDKGTIFIHRGNLDGSGVVESLAAVNTGYYREDMAIDDANGKLYITDSGGGVRRTDMDGLNEEVVIYNPIVPTPFGLALDPAGGHVYWTAHDQQNAPGDPVPGFVRRALLNGVGTEDLVSSTGIVKPGALVLDRDAGKMYWTNQARDQSSGTILRANLDGTQFETLVTRTANQNGNINLFQLALDPLAGKMYWAEWGWDGMSGNTNEIRRANLDGSAIETVNVDYLYVENYGVRAVAVDADGGKIYFSERSSPSYIRRASLDGTSAETLITTNGDVWGITLDLPAGKLYWSTAPGSAEDTPIRRANLDGSAVESVFAEQVVGLTYLDVDSATGKLYWFPSSEDPPYFRRGNVNGSGLEAVLFSLMERAGHGGLAVDASCCQLYGDLLPGGHGTVDVDDLLFVLTSFISPVASSPADIAPCGGDGQIDVDDILAALQAFTGFYLCPSPCDE